MTWCLEIGDDLAGGDVGFGDEAVVGLDRVGDSFALLRELFLERLQLRDLGVDLGVERRCGFLRSLLRGGRVAAGR